MRNTINGTNAFRRDRDCLNHERLNDDFPNWPGVSTTPLTRNPWEFPMMDDPRRAIVGMWRLAHYVEFRPDGTTNYPFGEDAIGYISYSESGFMSVQMSPRQRAQTRAVGQLDYLAYFGRYELDTERQLVRHFLEGQFFPGRHPEMLERKFRFYDDKLSLRPCDGAHWEILWQRT
jgi:hypothetical protein